MEKNIQESAILDLCIKLGEQMVDNAARRILEEYFGVATFIGASIEQFVRSQTKTEVIYEHINDPSLFGGSVDYIVPNTTTTDNYVFINTYHSSRVQYFTLAHELFHLTDVHASLIKLISDHNLDVKQLEKVLERSADHFAAALLLPENLVKHIWEKLIDLDIENQEVLIYNLADMSSAPYEAVARRVIELDLHKSKKLTKEIKTKLSTYKDSDWERERIQYMSLPSPLDMKVNDVQGLLIQNTETAPLSDQDEIDPLAEFI